MQRVKSLRWGFKLQGLAWPFVELTRHFVEIGLRVPRQVGSLRKVLSQQTIGVSRGAVRIQLTHNWRQLMSGFEVRADIALASPHVGYMTTYFLIAVVQAMQRQLAC